MHKGTDFAAPSGTPIMLLVQELLLEQDGVVAVVIVLKLGITLATKLFTLI